MTANRTAAAYVPCRRRLACCLIAICGTSAIAGAADLNFDFGSTDVQPGHTRISPETMYDPDRGHGYLEGFAPAADGSAVFAVDVGEGNYDVTVRFGDPARATSTTVRAESRRLMLEKVETRPGEFTTRTFTVNVRRPTLAGGGSVSLKETEQGPPIVPDWDEQLTLEFLGAAPGVASVEIRPATDAVTLYIAGDSTVTNQPRGPYSAWGPMLPRFFGQGVAISNHSWSGLTLTAFDRQKRLQKILGSMKKGDYLFIQFGHNDQKEKGANVGPYTSYKANLKRYIEQVRGKGGNPVLVTPVERRRWKDGQPQPTLADFADAVRQVGNEESVPVIDLNAMSLQLYAALGESKSTKALVFYPANTFAGQDKELKDNTHHSLYGGYQLARCVVEGIKSAVPDLAARLAPDAGAYDPAKPDDPETFELGPTPTGSAEKPAGD